jgi:hypothetical protein
VKKTTMGIAAWALLLALLPSPLRGGEKERENAAANSVVKLYVTYQEYEAASPWKKRDNKSRSGYACVLPSKRLLTTADIIKDHTLIEVEKSSSGEYFTAQVVAVDYDVDLAVLAVDDGSFFSDLEAVEFDPDISVDQAVQFMVFDDSGQVRAMPGSIVQIMVDEYYLGMNDYLLFGATASFEGRGGGWSEPVFSEGKLVGLTMTYSSEKQYAKIIPASIILHFLDAIRDGRYAGFPHHGFWYAVLRNPDFREFIGLPPGVEGVYVRHIIPGGSADGVLEVGDVVTSVDGYRLDWDGNYRHPEWGKLDFRDRISRYHYPGDVIELGIFRDGTAMKKEMKLKRLDQSHYLIPLICCDRRPKYLIVGGLVVQELTVDYLKAWGEKWQDRANKKFLYYYRYKLQDQQPDRKRIVFLNKVLPDDINVGYQDMDNLVLSSVNGRAISTIEDVGEALLAPENGFQRFTFEEYGREVVLDDERLPEADSRISARYGIDRLRNME